MFINFNKSHYLKFLQPKKGTAEDICLRTEIAFQNNKNNTCFQLA